MIKSPIAVLSLLIPAVVAIYVCGAVGVWYVWMGTIGKSSEITISLNFTAEHAENAEASENPSRIGTVLKLCALRGDKSLDF